LLWIGVVEARGQPAATFLTPAETPNVCSPMVRSLTKLVIQVTFFGTGKFLQRDEIPSFAGHLAIFSIWHEICVMAIKCGGRRLFFAKENG
jgi:hypothetical protein